MRITFDPAKRAQVLADPGLDFAEAELVFEGYHLTRLDTAHSDVEERRITIGQLHDDIVLVVWTERDGARRIITMWKPNERERLLYQRGRPCRRRQAGTR